ncbi:MAG TPA: epoxyqueuosine reductase [Nitrospirae bacterium]|nr:epoxyqueuosine reductase [bacterium BMS3Abin06]HDH10808.1 epoxyqueuosine reductase [Nitrospirota bacterium]HDZ00948.1 epoxyqueuosine reductase [Nitrospirota bacterium]
MYDELKTIALSAGATAFGVGHVEDLRTHYDALPLDQTEGMAHGISIGIRVSSSVLKSCIIGPTRLYLHHYRMINWVLDQTTLRISLAIQDKGYNALPIPASQIVDWEKQTAHLSHKMIALRAGIGWIGRNNMLVHSDCGSKIRIATVLTDMPLKTDSPIERDCGECKKCIEICPVSAIKESYKDWNKVACLEKLKYFAKAHNVGQYICGLCVKVCNPS